MHKLREAIVSLNDLYLDPNNPRYADIDLTRPILEERVHEEKVQERALQRILEERFDVRQLEESIQTIGFLTVDRLVVVELPQKGKYMVIEGNRRLAALKSLIRDDDSGDITLSPEVKASMMEIPVLIIEDSDKTTRDHTARILQGVRHLSSVKQWGPYQQAQLIALMIDDGKTMGEIREVLGLQPQRINMLRRCYFALAEMREDPDFGDAAKPGLFSHFEEALKVPTVRKWLGWIEEDNSCSDIEHRQMFYAWCVGIEENGTRHPPKITDAKDTRRLPALMEDPGQFKRFIEDPALTLTAAIQGSASSTPQIDWRGVLQANINMLSQIPALALAEASDADVTLIETTKRLCDQLLQYSRNARGSA